MQTHETVIFVGPSALGKTFGAESLMQLYPNEFIQAKLYTTRPPRGPGDASVDRIHVDTTSFQGMVELGRFLVHGEFGGNRYGFTEESLVPDTKHLLVNAWPALIPQLAELNPKPILVGLQAPSEWWEMLGERMKQRGDDEPTIQKRFGLIENDMRLVTQHAGLINESGKVFVVGGDETIPEIVIPWILQRLGLPVPK